jgi:hypothetical protein
MTIRKIKALISLSLAALAFADAIRYIIKEWKFLK